MLESALEKHFVKRANEHGAFVRKVKWIAHNGAPDRLVILNGKTVWVELKSPACGPCFPASAHERAQAREHDRMRAAGADVRVIWSREAIDALFTELTCAP